MNKLAIEQYNICTNNLGIIGEDVNEEITLDKVYGQNMPSCLKYLKYLMFSMYIQSLKDIG